MPMFSFFGFAPNPIGQKIRSILRFKLQQLLAVPTPFHPLKNSASSKVRNFLPGQRFEKNNSLW